MSRLEIPPALKTFFRVIKRIEDPRKDRGQRHDFAETILIALLAMMCGADDAEGFESWGDQNEAWLRRYLRLRHGIPSQDTFLRLFAILDTQTFVSTVTEWVGELLPSFPEPHFCVDGKTIRGSRHGPTKGKHIVSAWLTQAGVALGQEVVADKENEIVAIPKVLQRLALKGATVTIDAMGTQRNIATQIVSQGGHYVLTVKDNQPTLRRDLAMGFAHARSSQTVVEPPPCMLEVATTTEKDHGRIETRTCTLIRDILAAFGPQDWPHLVAAAEIQRTREHILTGNIERETVYVITSNPNTNADHLLAKTREHWGIENKLHWQLDMTFGEDAWTGRKGNLAPNMSALRKLVMYLLAQKPAPSRKKKSLKLKRFYCNANESYRLEVLSGLVPTHT